MWSDLNLAFPLPVGHHRRAVVDGLMLSGSMPGMLKRWVRSSPGEWYGLVWVPLGNEDADIRLTLDDPFMSAALRCANDQHLRMIQASHRQSEHSAMSQLGSGAPEHGRRPRAVAGPTRAPTGYPAQASARRRRRRFLKNFRSVFGSTTPCESGKAAIDTSCGITGCASGASEWGGRRVIIR